MSKSIASIASIVAATAIVAGADTVAVAPAAPKVPSKKSLAMVIFADKMTERSQGLFASNKDFRAAVLRAIETDLGVSTASAATMYNAAKLEAEAADNTVALGRDPKAVKVKVEGAKRGRPAKSKTVIVADEIGAEVAAPAEAVAA